MNFHKTIGFLATLLLMLGLGVPDSFAQEDVSSLSLTVSPRTLRDSTSAAVTVTARLTLTLASPVTEAAKEQPEAVTLAVSGDTTTGNADNDNVSYTVSGGGSVKFVISAGETKATQTVELVFSLSHDDDSVDEEVTVTATSDTNSDIKKEAKITVTDHSATLATNAVSARGYQVFFTKPTGANYAKAAKDAVIVEVKRKRGLASEYGAFSSIKVALRNRNAKGDADVPDQDLYSLKIDDAQQLGSLTLPRVRSAEVTGDTGIISGTTALNAGNTKAYFTRGSDYDVLEFRFHPTNGGSYDKVYALATFVTTDASDTDPQLSSLATDISIYPNGPELFPGEVVGNGKTGKLDAGKPATGIVTGIAIEIGDTEVPSTVSATETQDDLLTSGYTAGVGQTIKITVSMTDFAEHSLQLEIIGRDARSFPDADDTDVGVTKENSVIAGHTFKKIPALDVLRAVSQGKPVVVEVPVKAGQFKRKADVAAHPTDKSIKKNGLYEDDNVVVKVRAKVFDRAGNNIAQQADSPPFILDSRLPKVTITYPKPSATDSTRFTAALTQDYAFLDGGGGTADLKPLNFKVDESTSAVYVVINEDTLTVDHDDTMPLAELAGGYNLTAEGGYELKNPDKPEDNKHPEADSKQGGKAVDLRVVAKDRVGNTGVGMPAGGDAIFDAKAPKVTMIFPTNDALEEALDNKIGGDDRTQDPIFQVNEATDSILVRYVSTERTLDVVLANGSDAVDENIAVQFMGDNALVEDEAYDLQIYARDLAGHVGISDADDETDGAQAEQDLVFEAGLMNPQASSFDIVTEVRTGADAAFAKEDSVVAGQSVRLEITAIDAMLDDRAAIAYRTGVTVSAMDSDGNMVSSASFSGTGVTDNEDGSASLDGSSWSVGVFSGVLMNATMAGDYTIAVKEMDSAGVAVVTGTADIHVDAANFVGFNISILENNQPVDDIRGAFQLSVEPADEFGNASVKAYKGDALADTLDLLDSRMPDATTLSYDDGIDATFNAWPVLEQLPPPIFPLPVSADGRIFGFPEAPAAQTLWIHVAVVNANLHSEDMQSKDASSSKTFDVKSALMPALTLWGPDGEDWTEETEITVPADAAEGAMITVQAEGYEAGSTVTFSDGTEATADDSGNAALKLPFEVGTVTVSATDGRFMAAEKTWMFVETPSEPVRMAYVDADGNPVYLVSDADMTVGTDDFLALVAAYGSSKGDENYNVQADLDDDGDVDIDDYLMFIASYGRTATGPATKPLVLLPGINENAEFSLNLGSERVVAGELVAVDVSLANVEALVGYGFALNYETDKFEFVSVAPADSDLLTSTGGETLFHHVVADGQITIASGLYNGTAVSGGGDVVRFVFRVLREFEDNARFEIADGLVFDPSQLQNPAVVAGVLELQSTPREFALHQNFPNPFNPDTTIKYDLAESADVTLQIYNVLGQVIRTLVASETQNAGRYQIRWNGMDDRGVPVSSGVYFYQISAEGKFQHVRKLMLLK